MDHFYEPITGWFDFQQVYAEMVAGASDGAHFLELGALYGKSTSYMAVEIVNSGKAITFDVVDTWRGSRDQQLGRNEYQPAMVNDTAFDLFQQNMLPVRGVYHPLKMTGDEAAKLYQDESLDFVFIDADHEYDSICQDIDTWFPKVKIGGFIGGHDYIAGQTPRPFVYHATAPCVGVAVDERFGTDFRHILNSWLHQKRSSVFTSLWSMGDFLTGRT